MELVAVHRDPAAVARGLALGGGDAEDLPGHLRLVGTEDPCPLDQGRDPGQVGGPHGTDHRARSRAQATSRATRAS